MCYNQFTKGIPTRIEPSMSVRGQDLIYSRYRNELSRRVEHDLDLLLTRIFLHLPFNSSSIHGIDHIYQVLKNGLELAEQTGADKTVVALFAVFHDFERKSDGFDPGHGKRGALAAQQMRRQGFFQIDEERFEKLVYACTCHTDGLVSPDPTVGTCWDADRLELTRVGIFPRTKYLSTQAAKAYLSKGLGM